MTTGLLLAVLGGLMCGSLTLLTRRAGRQTGRVNRAIRSALALLIVPWTIALLTVPHVGMVYAQAGLRSLSMAAGLGSLWGAAVHVFAWSHRRWDVSLIFPAAGGPAAVVGSMIPLLVLHPARIATVGAWVLIAGAALALAGAACFVWSSPHPRGEELLRVLLACAVCGMLAACLNLGLVMSRPVTLVAERNGSTPAASVNAILPLILGGAFAVDFLACLAFPGARKAAPAISQSEHRLELSISVVFGLLAGATFAVYAAATTALGDFGAIAGWPIVLCVAGVSTGLWGQTMRRRFADGWQVRAAGIVIFVAAGGLLSYAITLLDRGL